MTWHRRTTEDSHKNSMVVWKVLGHVGRDDRSPKQVAGDMKNASSG